MAECVINAAAAAAVETGTRRRLLSSKTTEPVSSKQFGQLAFFMPGGHPHNLPAMTSSSRRMKAARALCWLSARLCDFVIGLSGTSVVLLEMNSLTSQFEGVHMNIIHIYVFISEAFIDVVLYNAISTVRTHK